MCLFLIVCQWGVNQTLDVDLVALWSCLLDRARYKGLVTLKAMRLNVYMNWPNK